MDRKTEILNNPSGIDILLSIEENMNDNVPSEGLHETEKLSHQLAYLAGRLDQTANPCICSQLEEIQTVLMCMIEARLKRAYELTGIQYDV